MLGPGKLSGIHDGACDGGAVAAHILGQCMHDNVGAVFEWATQSWRCDGVVNDERHAVAMCRFCQSRKVNDAPGGIAYGFAEHGASLGINQGFQCRYIIMWCELDGNTLARKGVRE